MTAVTTPAPTEKPERMTLAVLLDKAAPSLEPLLFPGSNMERVKAEVFFAARKDPKIALCTPDSVVRAVATCIQRDLVIGETIHLVPMKESYKDGNQWRDRLALQAWSDWKGDIELVVRAGVAQSVKVMAVYTGEHFVYREGLEPFIEHHPGTDTATRGTLLGAYAVARVKYGHYVVVWMPLGDIEAIRAKSQSWGPGKVPECPGWYARKTVVHQICKRLPKNPKLRDLLAMQREDLEIPEGEVSSPVVVENLPSGHPAKLLQHGDDAYATGTQATTGATMSPAAKDVPRAIAALLDRMDAGESLADDELEELRQWDIDSREQR